MTSRRRRSASADGRSATPEKRMTSLPPALDATSTVKGPASDGSVRRTLPGANRTSGSSVHGSTKTSPRTPLAGPIRPIVMSPDASATASAAVDVDDVDANPLAADTGDHLTQRLGGASVAADHPAEIVGMNADLQALASPVVDEVDAHVVGVIDDAPDQMLEGFLEHVSSPPARRPQPARPSPRSVSQLRVPQPASLRQVPQPVPPQPVPPQPVLRPVLRRRARPSSRRACAASSPRSPARRTLRRGPRRNGRPCPASRPAAPSPAAPARP